jgi:hypothetical protein
MLCFGQAAAQEAPSTTAVPESIESGLAVSGLPAADGVGLAERDTYIGLRTLDGVFETYREATGTYPSSGARLQRVDNELKRNLGEPYSHHVPARDGWGNPYFYHTHDGELMLVSSGPNGVLDDPEAMLAVMSERTGSAYRAKSIDGDDVIMVGGSIAKKTPGHRQRQMTTLADMRSLGTALEEYKLDHGVMPGPTNGFVRVFEIEAYLTPDYINSIPIRDDWESEFLLWCGTHDCVLVSLGADREPDTDYGAMTQPLLEIVPAGSFSSPGGDIIFINDGFVAFPEGMDP